MGLDITAYSRIMRGFTCFLPNRTVALGWQHLRIGLPEVTRAYRTFAIARQERFPQLATRFGGTITKGQTNNPARLAFQGNPNPDLLAFGADK